MTDPSDWKTPEDWTDRIVDVVDDDLARVAFEEIIRAAQRAAFDEAIATIRRTGEKIALTDDAVTARLITAESMLHAIEVSARRDELLGDDK